MNANMKNLGPWSKFEAKHNSQGQYWFKTYHGRYLVGRTNGSLQQSEHIRRWEKFTPTCVKQSGTPYESVVGEGISGGSSGSATNGELEMGGANGNSGNKKLCF